MSYVNSAAESWGATAASGVDHATNMRRWTTIAVAVALLVAVAGGLMIQGVPSTQNVTFGSAAFWVLSPVLVLLLVQTFNSHIWDRDLSRSRMSFRRYVVALQETDSLPPAMNGDDFQILDNETHDIGSIVLAGVPYSVSVDPFGVVTVSVPEGFVDGVSQNASTTGDFKTLYDRVCLHRERKHPSRAIGVVDEESTEGAAAQVTSSDE